MPMPSAFNVSRLLVEATLAEGRSNRANTDDVPLKELVREVVDDGGMETSVCGCRLLVKGADPYHLRADRELLRRAIENIVRNAIRHAPDGTSIDITFNGSPLKDVGATLRRPRIPGAGPSRF
jgi:signal transduction histidine kinase